MMYAVIGAIIIGLLMRLELAMEFYDWLDIGLKNKWISKPVCFTHDGIPSTDAEDAEWENGYDPCMHGLRLWDDDDSS